MPTTPALRFGPALVLCAALTGARGAHAADSPEEVNVLSWGEGALVVQPVPAESKNGQWSANVLLDEMPDTGWANPRNDLTPKSLVFELAARARITSFVFDTAQVYSKERAAKDVKVEISDAATSGFVEIAKATLAQMKDGQRVALAKPAAGRYLKLTVLNGYGDTSFMEIMNFKAFGAFTAPSAAHDYSGTYDTSYGMLHLLQTGNSVVGCYEHLNGLVETGVVDRRVLRFTWSSDENAEHRWNGPALMIFPDDGKSVVGYFWHGNTEGKEAPRDWDGTFVSKEVGSCPNWKPSGGNVVEQQLERSGRARLYGILFDTDSDHLKPESKTTLDALVGAARNQPAWKFTIEGHTDNIGTAPHNQTLSEQRAAAVKAYMVHAGIDAARLTTQGFGSTRPVATNDTSIGRAQNRRVEVSSGK